MQHVPVQHFQVLTSALSGSFCWKRQDKGEEKEEQGQVA